jgi:hypothetical protein
LFFPQRNNTPIWPRDAKHLNRFDLSSTRGRRPEIPVPRGAFANEKRYCRRNASALSCLPATRVRHRRRRGARSPAWRPVRAVTPAHRWPARAVCSDAPDTNQAEVCATLWPTRHLHGPTRWFDELYLWAEGFAPSPAQWSRIQLTGLQRALALLAREQAEQVGVTLSYDTVQQFDEPIVRLLEGHALVAHRLTVMLRGSIEPLRAPARVRAFVGYLRARQICVGLRVTTPRLAMSLAAFELVQPQFAKFLAPAAPTDGAWDALATEARFTGISADWLIAAGLQSAAQLRRAVDAGIGFGQGTAVRPASAPVEPVAG